MVLGKEPHVAPFPSPSNTAVFARTWCIASRAPEGLFVGILENHSRLLFLYLSNLQNRS
jgi:hypothetical protein